MNRVFILAAIAMFTAIIFTSCSGSTNPVAPTGGGNDTTARFEQWHFGDAGSTLLIAGKTMEVGTVTVSNDYDYLYITYETTGDWYLSETHLHVADDLTGIPMTKSGNPKNGKFDYKNVHNPGVQYFTYTVDLGDWKDCGTGLFIAAHASVYRTDDKGKFQQETAWGEGEDFPGNNWAMYFTYEVQCCVIDLPDCDAGVQAKYFYPGTLGYWDVQLSGVPGGYDVWDGLWPGWCVQRFVYAYPNVWYNLCLISVYDENLPDSAQGIDWEKIAYVLNHKHPNATNMDIQQAIWFFTPAGFNITDPEAQSMVDEALANGEGYVPGAGELMAVLAYINENTQLIFIEVEIGC